MRWWSLLVISALVACAEPQRGSRFVADAGDDATKLDGSVRCTTDRACDDFIACTVDRCVDATCRHEACTDCCQTGLQCIVGFGCGRPPRSCTTNAECSDGVRCTLDACNAMRVCQNTPQADLCASGEICLAAVGCLPRPPDRCAVDSDCNTSVCGGTWRCEPELGCGFRSPTNCDDNNACTTDTCDAARGGCQHTPRDRDGDEHGDTMCGGDDCDDTDPARRPGAAEICGDGIDQDCDGADRGCCRAGDVCATTCGSMGTRTCTAMGTPDRCEPLPETCNGRDDDCDGAIDNGFACASGGVVGCVTACGSMGMQTCSATCALGACTPPAETCNGRDDNCDGVTDEGCCAGAMMCTTTCGSVGTTTCTSGGTAGPCMPGPESCNGRDDNCDGAVDNGFACARGSVSACMTACGTAGTQTCSDACTLGACVAPMEVCNGRDDNCDGRTDEGCCSMSTPCMTACGSTGTTLCNAAGMASGCRAPAESCNGRDDDCDGAIDNGFACAPGATGTCTTACGTAGTRSCGATCGWGACAAPAETCNGRDDNCDGVIDNGFACARGAVTMCTTSCGSRGEQTCSATCTPGACTPPPESCNGRDDNCDGRTDEGCCSTATPCTSTCGSAGTTTCNAAGMPTGCRAPAESCNRRDDDCDGIIDNGFACISGSTGACMTACGTAGTRTCNATCTWDACTPPAETCNGRDDNCDGRTDEGCCSTSTPCTTTCGTTGTTICSAAGLPTGCRPPTETCNGRDDDCDGVVDNGFACVRGATLTCTTACGSAGSRVCDGACALGACVAPAESCNGRDDDCNGTVDNGFACAQGSVGTCTTACGSTGARTCSAACTLGACTAPAESCNGRDDDCDGAIDNGFACAAGATGSCTTACGSTGTRVCSGTCAWGTCAPPVETCNGRDDNCDGRTDEGCCSTTAPCTTTCSSTGTTLCNAAGMPTGCRAPAETCNGRDDDCDGAIDNGFACLSGATGACTTACGSTGRRTCLASCAWDTCAPPAETCNGADDNCNGTCDDGFTCCARSTRACSALGFVSGTATCRSDCGGYDTTGCSNCGNGRVDTGEQCDGAALGGATCVSQGFGAGTLRCNANCTFDTTACPNCGNGRIDTGEQCDGTALNGQSCTSLAMGFTGGTLSCGSACTFVTTACTRPFNPTGTWLVSPGVNYYCAFGLVTFSFGNLTFNDTGTGLSVSGGGINCTMTGPSSRTTRMVNVSCSLPGGCTETYRLVGTYSTDNSFTGTFTATFTGSGCFDCASQTSPVSASR